MKTICIVRLMFLWLVPVNISRGEVLQQNSNSTNQTNTAITASEPTTSTKPPRSILPTLPPQHSSGYVTTLRGHSSATQANHTSTTAVSSQSTEREHSKTFMNQPADKQTTTPIKPTILLNSTQSTTRVQSTASPLTVLSTVLIDSTTGYNRTTVTHLQGQSIDIKPSPPVHSSVSQTPSTDTSKSQGTEKTSTPVVSTNRHLTSRSQPSFTTNSTAISQYTTSSTTSQPSANVTQATHSFTQNISYTSADNVSGTTGTSAGNTGESGITGDTTSTAISQYTSSSTTSQPSASVTQATHSSTQNTSYTSADNVSGTTGTSAGNTGEGGNTQSTRTSTSPKKTLVTPTAKTTFELIAQTTRQNQVEKQSGHSKTVAWLIGGLLVFMMIGFLIIYLQKRKRQNRHMSTTDWAGPSPFLDGDGATPLQLGPSNRVSLISFLPARLSRRLSLIQEQDREMEDMMPSTTFGQCNHGSTFEREVGEGKEKPSNGSHRSTFEREVGEGKEKPSNGSHRSLPEIEVDEGKVKPSNGNAEMCLVDETQAADTPVTNKPALLAPSEETDDIFNMPNSAPQGPTGLSQEDYPAPPPLTDMTEDLIPPPLNNIIES